LRLYKFIDNKKGNVAKLCDGVIYLTPPKYLNDTQEFRYSPGMPPDSAILAMLNKYSAEEYRSLPAASRRIIDLQAFQAVRAQLARPYIEFLTSPSYVDGIETRTQDEMSRIVGVTSLTERATDAGIWNDYADDLAGLAIELVAGDDFMFPDIPACPLALGTAALKVSYTTALTTAPRTSAGIAKILTTKDASRWGHEGEWRIVWPLAWAAEVRLIDNAQHFFWRLEKGTVRGICYGGRMDSALRHQVDTWLQRAHPGAYSKVARKRDGRIVFNER